MYRERGETWCAELRTILARTMSSDPPGSFGMSHETVCVFRSRSARPAKRFCFKEAPIHLRLATEIFPKPFFFSQSSLQMRL